MVLFFYVTFSNIGPLMEITKMGNRVVSHQTHQDAQLQNQNNLLQAQQVGNYCCLTIRYILYINIAYSFPHFYSQLNMFFLPEKGQLVI
jgi:hypothetical protein